MHHGHEFHALEVTDVVEETPDARSFVLRVPSGLASTFAYASGQFCSFRATIDGAEVVRCYSMSSSPEVGDPLATTVKRVEGGVMSNWMIDSLRPGDTIEAMPPTGFFVLRESEAPIVAFAGGSGITPIFSIIKSALAATRREIALIYANKSAEDVIFGRALEELVARSEGRLSLHSHLDTAGGFLDADACAALIGDRAHGDFYVCGPTAYMDTVEAGLAKRGVGEDQLFIERFAVSDDESAEPAGDAGAETESLVIRNDRRKREVRYTKGDTILEAARRAGLSPPFACEAGSCATCMARVVEGSAKMRTNNALTPDEVEEGWVLTCQAIPTSRELFVDYDA